MAKITHNIIEKQAIKWLENQGWKVLPEEVLETILYSTKLENLPYKPHLLIEKGEDRFFVNIFNKEDYFPSKTENAWMTGFEWYKYIFSQVLGDITGISTAILLHNETLKEFAFRQLAELPTPKKWRIDSCLAKGYGRRDEILQCFKCWKIHPQTIHNCIYRKTKTRPMAAWDVENFSNNTNFQIRLFQTGFSNNKEFKKVVAISRIKPKYGLKKDRK